MIEVCKMFHDDDRSTGNWLFNNVDQTNDVGTPLEVLEDLDLTSDLLQFHWFEQFDDAKMMSFIKAFIDFTIPSLTDLARYEVAIKCTKELKLTRKLCKKVKVLTSILARSSRSLSTLSDDSS